MKTIRFGKTAGIIAIFCAATAVASHAQTFTTLLDFHGSNGGQPESALVQGTDGNFYGSSSTGGTGTGGTVFKITPGGKLTTLYSFCTQSNCADGTLPGQILLAADGNFYGTTIEGGATCQELVSPGCGTVFKITPGGTFTTLYSFCSQTNCADGWAPNSLVQGLDGNFYGTTRFGGNSNASEGPGTIFKITRAGALTTIYDFCSVGGPNSCSDGSLPYGMILGSNGNFYGTTSEGGGADGCGDVFEATPTGKLTVVHSFTTAQGCGEASGRLLEASDGNFYGTTVEGGGAHRQGMVYKVTPAGRLSELYGFCALANCADGKEPQAGVVQGTDGNFYGTTHGQLAGARTTYGTIFQLTPTGAITTLETFDSHNGAWPGAPLLQATNGNFYGSTGLGGASGCPETCGTVFRVSMGLGPFVEASPNFGVAGRVVEILGNNLTGTTNVTFNGTPTTFSVISSTLIKAQVPTGATTGTIDVTTPSGTLSSNVGFQVK
jgi:uncharacterized repeat protein (TIGR03803 family)